MSNVNIISFFLLLFIFWRITIGPKCGNLSSGPCYLENFECYNKFGKERYACYYNQRNYRKCTWY